MFWKNRKLSVRGKLVLWTTLTGAIIALVGNILIFAICHRQIYGMHKNAVNRLLDDIYGEYESEKDISGKFLEHIKTDAEEHNINVTQIRLVENGKTVFSTRPLPHLHNHAIMSKYRQLYVDLKVEILRDINEVVDFDLFLAILLSTVCLISVISLSVFSWFIGDRILRLNETVELKNKALEELKTLTDDIAHDLRTPLTRLRMAAERVQLSGHQGDGNFASVVAEETSSMVEMINTMLEISQSGFQIDRTPRENIDITALMGKAVELYEAVAAEKHITLKTNLPSSPTYYSAHRSKLQCVIGNLLDNAFKFTKPGGSIIISMSTSKNKITIICSDTGCGISENDQRHIFQRFYRADTSRNLEGNGLGLALVHAIITSYGGTITCISKLGVGSSFIINLPY